LQSINFISSLFLIKKRIYADLYDYLITENLIEFPLGKDCMSKLT